jgi:hypothetical protein
MLRAQGGATPAGNIGQTLFVLRNANMTLATDQAFTKLFSGTNYVATGMIAVQKSGAFGVACVGGVYTGAGKTGDAIVPAATAFTPLTGAGTVVSLNQGVLLPARETATPFLSLTTGNTGALTADLFITGIVVD